MLIASAVRPRIEGFMPVNFDLNDLYAFRALVEFVNFRLAAESICLSQSAVSRRIDKLETTLGIKLFERTTRRVTLTLKGHAFAQRSEKLPADFEEVMADLSEVSLARTGLITAPQHHCADGAHQEACTKDGKGHHQ